MKRIPCRCPILIPLNYPCIPDLKACSAFGETPDEALREVEIAKEAWLRAAKAEHKPLPAPRYRPAIPEPL